MGKVLKGYRLDGVPFLHLRRKLEKISFFRNETETMFARQEEKRMTGQRAKYVFTLVSDDGSCELKFFSHAKVELDIFYRVSLFLLLQFVGILLLIISRLCCCSLFFLFGIFGAPFALFFFL